MNERLIEALQAMLTYLNAADGDRDTIAAIECAIEVLKRPESVRERGVASLAEAMLAMERGMRR